MNIYRINKIKDKFNAIQVTNFHNRSTLNPGIIESTHGLNQSSKQDDQTFINMWIDRYTMYKNTFICIYNYMSE